MRLRIFRIALPLALLLMAVALVSTTRRLEAWADSPYPLAPTKAFRPAQLRLASATGPGGDTIPAEVPAQFDLRPGETIDDALADLGVENRERSAIVAELAKFADLRRLKPDDCYEARFDRTARLESFELTLDGRGRVRVLRDGEDWAGAWVPFERRTETRSLGGHLEGAFESSIRRAGGEPRLAYALADVFQWDLDFNRDLRAGDSFELVFENVYLDGRYHAPGDILAATYVNRGRTLEAYRFGDPAAYYDAEGRPLRKMFLRSPLRYSRITSSFSHRRFHPVLKRYRPHLGVDYGAPVGTPVRVTAAGVVTFAGWDRGGGRTVKVRHPNGYLTAYLHLSKFASGVRSGRRVRQGETIGYVGSTGLATGPHLDYRVQRDGRWINPLSIKSVPADPVPTERLAEFLALRDALREELRRAGGTPADDRAGDRIAVGPPVDPSRPVPGAP